jgi:hypothetical protein
MVIFVCIGCVSLGIWGYLVKFVLISLDIQKIQTKKQLENIESIQLYEYDLKHEFDQDGAHLHETGGM